jgi:GH25 family lysozyme M1 (1,4-beta-N-acetylmuramidase)
VTDLVFPDISGYQPPASDAYTGEWLSIKANDGTLVDGNFVQNYAWCVAACDRGQMTGFTVYSYWRPNAVETARVLIDQVTAAGGPHPRMTVMCDLERGGNPMGDQTAGVLAYHQTVAAWLGTPLGGGRTFTYGNRSDLATMDPVRPAGHRVIVAAYGGPAPTDVPGYLAHQFTDAGTVPGFPPCDLNAANGMTAADFAAALGLMTGDDVSYTQWPQADREQLLREIGDIAVPRAIAAIVAAVWGAPINDLSADGIAAKRAIPAAVWLGFSDARAQLVQGAAVTATQALAPALTQAVADGAGALHAAVHDAVTTAMAAQPAAAQAAVDTHALATAVVGQFATKLGA